MTELELTGALVLVVKPHDSAVTTDAIGRMLNRCGYISVRVIRPAVMLS